MKKLSEYALGRLMAGVLIRILYAPGKTSSYRQIVERSSDHGATWQPGGVTTYQSKR